jgi:hypothetical protein
VPELLDGLNGLWSPFGIETINSIIKCLTNFKG